MEQLIIIGLLLIIILILWDKKFSDQHPQEKNTNNQLNLPSVMGETKKEDRRPQPSDAYQSQNGSIVSKADKFGSETEEEVFENALNKNLEDILVKNEVREEEEEDWKYQDDSKSESRFATGVTFQELSTARQLLQQDVLESDLEQQAVTTIQKIQDTEFFDLLENSLGDASNRIADLLSRSISNEDKGISLKHKDGAEGFDIGEFV